MLISLGLLNCDFVEEIWMNFMNMKLGDFESMKIERICRTVGASVICTKISKVINNRWKINTAIANYVRFYCNGS